MSSSIDSSSLDPSDSLIFKKLYGLAPFITGLSVKNLTGSKPKTLPDLVGARLKVLSGLEPPPGLSLKS